MAREKSIRIRVTELEHHQLMQAAFAAGMDVSDYVRSIAARDCLTQSQQHQPQIEQSPRARP